MSFRVDFAARMVIRLPAHPTGSWQTQLAQCSWSVAGVWLLCAATDALAQAFKQHNSWLPLCLTCSQASHTASVLLAAAGYQCSMQACPMHLVWQQAGAAKQVVLTGWD